MKYKSVLSVISFVQYINLKSTRGYLLTELTRKKKLDEQIDKDKVAV